MLSLETPASASGHDRMHFAIIRFVHESLYGIFVDPYSRLTKAEVKPGQQVLEVGCGPGFFTIPAAQIVGENGHVYALDINHVAVDHVKRKISQAKLSNAEARLADATATGLSSESIDVAFLFSVVHAFKDLNKVLAEMHRVLKADGILSIQSRLPLEKMQAVTAGGLFRLRENRGGAFVFHKMDSHSVEN